MGHPRYYMPDDTHNIDRVIKRLSALNVTVLAFASMVVYNVDDVDLHACEYNRRYFGHVLMHIWGFSCIAWIDGAELGQ